MLLLTCCIASAGNYTPILSNITAPITNAINLSDNQPNENPYINYTINESLAVNVINNSYVKLTNPDSNGHWDSVDIDGASHSTHVGRLTVSTTPYIVTGGYEFFGYNLYADNVTDFTQNQIDGNNLTNTNDNGNVQISNEFYASLIKEKITLNEHTQEIGYDYNITLSDWTTTENGTASTKLASGSTVNMTLDMWGNAVVDINNATTVVIPKPFATDKNGDNHQLEWSLDTENHKLKVAGLDNISSDLYPLIVDPTEMVTNGGFETGSLSGWSTSGVVAISTAYAAKHSGSYGVYFGAYGASYIAQNVELATVPVISFWMSSNSGSAGSRYHEFIIDSSSQATFTSSYTLAQQTYYINGDGAHTLKFQVTGTYEWWMDDISAQTNVPVVDFGQTYSAIWEGQSNTYTDYSYGQSTSWAWNFGDGQTSTDQNPSHTFSTAGTYSVSHTATNSVGTSGATTHTTSVWKPITAGASASTTTSSTGQSISFTDSSTGTSVNHWSWNFGDGGTSTSQNPSHAYSTPGSYTVTFTPSSTVTGDSDTTYLYITVYQPVSAIFSADVGKFAGQAVQFYDQSTGNPYPTSFLWTFGDGDSSNMATSAQSTFDAGSGWGASGGTLTYDTGTKLSGSASGKFVTTGSGDQFIEASYVSVSPNTQYTYSGYVYGNAQAYARIIEWTSGGTPTTERVATTITASSSWQRSTVTFTTASNTAKVSLRCEQPTAGTNYWDDVQLETGSSAYVWQVGNNEYPYHIYSAGGTYTVAMTATNSVGSTSTTSNTVTVWSPINCSFSANPTTANVGQSVSFTDSSTGSGINSWFWSFGDGVNSTSQNPTHVYSYSATYSVYHSASSSTTGSSDDELLTSYITVRVPTGAAFNWSGNQYTGQSIQFIDQSTGEPAPNSWAWNFGDGSTSTEEFPTHSYSTTGTYSVTLNVSNSAGSTSTITKQITIYTPITAGFTADRVVAGMGQSIQMTDSSTGSSVNTWYWNFGDGSTSTLQHPSHVYTNGGTFTVSLTAYSSVSGSSNTLNRTSYITIYSPITADFSASTQNIFSGNAIQFYDHSSGSPNLWYWDFGDGNYSTDQNPVHVYYNIGAYTVSETSGNTISGYNDTETKTSYILVQTTASADFVASPTSGALPLNVQFNSTAVGSPTSYYWNFGDSGSSTAENPIHTYADIGSYTVSLTVTSDAGESTFTRVNYIDTNTLIQQNRVQYSVSAVRGAAPLIVRFNDTSTGSGTVTRQWDFGDGNTSTEQNPEYMYMTAGTYNVMLTVASDVGTSSQNITLYVGGSGDNIAPNNYSQYSGNLLTPNTTLWDLPSNVVDVYATGIPRDLLYIIFLVIVFGALYVRTGSMTLPTLLYMFVGGFLAFMMPVYFGTFAFWMLVIGGAGAIFKLFV